MKPLKGLEMITYCNVTEITLENVWAEIKKKLVKLLIPDVFLFIYHVYKIL